jgi:hypothetical protein
VQKFTASRTGTHNWPCGHDAGITNVEPIRWKADE